MKRMNGMLKEVKSNGGWHTYIFSLILLLAQVLFREEVLTLSFDVNVWALKKERKLIIRGGKKAHSCPEENVPIFIYILRRQIWAPVSPIQ